MDTKSSPILQQNCKGKMAARGHSCDINDDPEILIFFTVYQVNKDGKIGVFTPGVLGGGELTKTGEAAIKQLDAVGENIEHEQTNQVSDNKTAEPRESSYKPI